MLSIWVCGLGLLLLATSALEALFLFCHIKSRLSCLSIGHIVKLMDRMWRCSLSLERVQLGDMREASLCRWCCPSGWCGLAVNHKTHSIVFTYMNAQIHASHGNIICQFWLWVFKCISMKSLVSVMRVSVFIHTALISASNPRTPAEEHCDS